MSVLKILHVIPNLVKGGAQRLVIDICNELQKHKNIKVKLVVFEYNNEFKYLSENIDIVICPAKISLSILKKNQIDISNYEKIVDIFQPDIIHSHLYLAEMVSRENSRSDITYFTHCHDNIIQFEIFQSNSLFSKKKLTDLYERFRLFSKYKKAKNNFIAISKDTQSFLQKMLPNIFKENIFLLPNGVNINSFSKPFYRAPKKELKLINVGNLLKKKNQIFLLHVIKHLKDIGTNINLKLIGDGEIRKPLLDEIERLDLKKEVELIGAVDDVQAYLWESDIYVHSALYEPFGLVLIEAMAAGLPVVCLDGKGNSDLIESGKNGFLVNEPTPNTFAERVVQIALNPKLHFEMSTFSKHFADQFAINFYVDKLLHLYKLKKKN